MGAESRSISVSLHLLHISAGDSCGSKSFSPGHLMLSWPDPRPLTLSNSVAGGTSL